MGKDGIKFKDEASLAADNIGTVVNLIGLSVPGGDKTTDLIGVLIEQGMEDPMSLFTPVTIWKFFANKDGTMSFEEFGNIFT